jgi:hypothetical protein
MGPMPHESYFHHEIRGINSSRPLGQVLAELAGRQHGVVARWQLLRLGINRRSVDEALALCRLHRLHRGIYAVGHRSLTRKGWLMAAVLACGPGAVLSHRTAAEVLGLHWRTSTPIEITQPRTTRRRPGIRTHRTALRADEVEAVDGLPVTTPFRTAFDVAGLGDRRFLEQVLHEIQLRQKTDAVSFAELRRRYPRRPGARLLAQVRGSKAPVGVTRNKFEERFVALLDAHGLPRPALNAPLAVRDRFFEIDALWRPQRLAAELDGREVHDTDDGFESDRERDRILLAEGWRTTRITWRQLRDTPAEVAADLRVLTLTANG